ncbi:MAG TPA: hydroxymethylglutaryl-CoA lyase [Lutibacter sp.]|nr:hydroxymethylglutaryl-CoA lyase [Lutibacter sp.]
MQGIKEFISTEKKLRYIQFLLSVGFDTIDFGSFVSPKAIPQLRDTAEIITKLDLIHTNTKLLAIVANVRGALDASKHDKITYLGYPFAISEMFQMRNTGQTISQSVKTLKEILKIAKQTNKEVVAYLSMGFGNPYGDPWSEEIVEEWTEKLVNMGVKILSLSDTVGTADPKIIHSLFSRLIPKYPQIEFGAHLHTHPSKWHEKVDAAYKGGCRRFDGAIKGYGGCPMARDHVTGNMPTEKLVSYFTHKKANTGLNVLRFESAYNEALGVFGDL